MRIFTIILVFLLVSCNKNESKEFIELTKGASMDPSEPRIGILINNKDSVYICREVIKNNERTEEYIFFNSLNKVSFNKYKNEMLKSFNKSFSFNSIPDAQAQQIVYYLNGKEYKQVFYFHKLSGEQKKVINDILKMSDILDLHEVSNHKFSQELLHEVNPIPPIK